MPRHTLNETEGRRVMGINDMMMRQRHNEYYADQAEALVKARERITLLEESLKKLVKAVEDQLETLDPCGEDCSEFHDLSLDVLPAVRKVLGES
jgi:hypothetical protein